MTDASAFPVKAINGSDLSHVSLASAYTTDRHHAQYHAPAHVENVEDESINCVCGYADDDGWTVACDICNRWQHQSCYYPDYDERSLPDDLAHFCVECNPRSLDVTRARLRQQEKRGPSEILVNGAKRNPPKSHKKKVKEFTAPYTNGWPLDKVRHDRNSASPRDQPPPAKRPKTSHRTSDSTTTTTKGHSRKRNASNVTHRRSLSRSPDSPIEQYSEEFLQCYQEDDWSIAEANLHNSISVTNALTDWLELHDDEFRNLHRSAKGEVLLRWDAAMDDIPGKAETDIVENRDNNVEYRGHYPAWKAVIVKEPVAVGGYIGELKGHVGFKKEYQEEDANRWSRLRHPEPFVFFHPKLPLVIDARHEGTEMRYIRRSCQPNARLQILVTNGVDYHFCFMATQQLEPGEEVAVGWDTADGLPELAVKPGLSEDELEVISGWVSTALANCGPCACSLPEQECMMSRFDRRARNQLDNKTKSKKRKIGQHISPVNTQAHSRSGSEARRVDPDEDGTDSRSTSGSAGLGSASRDITPNTHYSTNGQSSAMPELSERERKKLAKEEEIFRRQEEEQGKQAKKKRNSAGSSLSTPSTTSSKQFGFLPNNSSKYVDAGTSRQSGAPIKGMPGRKPKASKPVSRPVTRVVKRSIPVYVDAQTQCDMDQEEAGTRVSAPFPRKSLVPKRQRLLELCALKNLAIAAKQQSSRAATPKLELLGFNTCEKVVTSSAVPQSVFELSSKRPPLTQDLNKDTEMADAPAESEERSFPTVIQHQALLEETSYDDKQTASVEPPDPPWPLKTISPEATTVQSHKPPNMHLEMPPPASNPFALPSGPSAAVSPSSSIVQSPATSVPGSLFSPAVAAAVNPSPARKKLSLSDYTRRKAKTQDNESKTDRESSPASTTSGPVVPPLQPSSSLEARASENAIDEDVRMEDAAAEPTKA